MRQKRNGLSLLTTRHEAARLAVRPFELGPGRRKVFVEAAFLRAADQRFVAGPGFAQLGEGRREIVLVGYATLLGDRQHEKPVLLDPHFRGGNLHGADRLEGRQQIRGESRRRFADGGQFSHRETALNGRNEG